MPKDVVDGLRMFAGELRMNAERSVSAPQQASLSGRAMIVEGAANEIELLRKTATTERDAAIEITPEMIDAGAMELLRWDDRVDTRESAAERVFIAMLRAAPHDPRIQAAAVRAAKAFLDEINTNT